MKIEPIDADEAKEALRKTGFEAIEGLNNSRGEFWIDRRGKPFFFPYFHPDKQDQFVKEQVRATVRKLLIK